MTTQDDKRPLIDWVLAKFPDTPKKRAKQWITAGRIAVNGVVIRKPHEPVPAPGTALQLLDRQATTLDCGKNGWAIHPRVTLLHLDSSLAVVNKGPGLLSVPAQNYDLSALTILSDVLCGKLRVTPPVPAAYRELTPLPVHRLDQFTSGVFCMAMNPAARARLIDQLNARTMSREYVAYVEGCPQSPRGTWRNWLKISDDELRQFVVPSGTEGALESVTHYQVVAQYVGVTKIRLHLESGRRHQIRVQAAYAGLPLVGDRTYNPRGRFGFDRQALHAEKLSLEHPDRPGSHMSWTAVLPPDLVKLEASLRRK